MPMVNYSLIDPDGLERRHGCATCAVLPCQFDMRHLKGYVVESVCNFDI